MSLCVFFTFVFLKVLTLSVFSFLCVIPTGKSQRLCLLWRKIFCKRKLSYTDPLGLGRNFIARAKRALPSGQYRSRGWSYKKHIQINIFNNYSSSLNGLWINSLGYWLRGHDGEGNNCFSKIQLVKKISRLNIFRKLKLDFNPFLPSKNYKYGGRFSLLVGYNIGPTSSSTNQNAALIINH